MTEILEGLEEAIKDEQEAQKKYKKLKQQTDDENAKKLFEQLIEDEKNHEKSLRSRYQAIKESLGDEE